MPFKWVVSSDLLTLSIPDVPDLFVIVYGQTFLNAKFGICHRHYRFIHLAILDYWAHKLGEKNHQVLEK